MTVLTFCEYPLCLRFAHSRGLCKHHHTQRLRDGTLTPMVERQPKTCAENGCDAPVQARGLCSVHYGKKRRAGTLSAAPRRGTTKECIWCNTPLSQPTQGRKLRKCPRCAVIKWKYKITYAQSQERLAAQHGLCAFEGCEELATCLDHDHSCCPENKTCGGCLRGFLCDRHNLGLGVLGEDFLAAALAYVKRYQVPKAVISR